MRLRVARLAVASLASVAVAGSALVGPLLAAPAHAADGEFYDCLQIAADDAPVTDDSDSVPLGLLDGPRAQEAAASAPGRSRRPVAVAVVDSGVSTRSGLLDVAAASPWPSRELVSDHGTAVAGLIAGHARPDGKPIGVAPEARIVDVRVYQGATSPGEDEGLTTPGLVKGLDWIARNAGRLGIRVANVSLAVASSPALRAAVRRVVDDADVVLVAASGNRPEDDSDRLLWPLFGDGGSQTGPGEDAARVVYPAGYDDVVAVNATMGGYPGDEQTLDSFVLPNSQTDVAAPTYFGVSLALNGSTCRIPEVATSFAAAEVSGVVALLRTAYPTDSARQIVARLENTASGTTTDPTKYEGAGVVQPLEALTRPMRPARDGTVARATVQDDDQGRAAAPQPEADALASTRHHAVWWGLLGGGALLVALMLRPVLARRED